MSVTEDSFLNGKVRISQPVDGFRAGLDAVFLAAAIPARAGDDVLELGAGVGTASLCLAARVADCAITGVEINATLCEIANGNAALNGLQKRISFIEGDVLRPPRVLLRDFAHVFCNPPFHTSAGAPSPDDTRRRALQDGDNTLHEWLRAGLKRTAEGGTFTAILRADRLDEALNTLHGKGTAIFPLWPRKGEAAKRVLVQTRKSSGAPLRLLAGLVLHRSYGSYTEEADAILRGGASLALDSRPL